MRAYLRYWPDYSGFSPSCCDEDDARDLMGEALAADVESLLTTPRYARAVAMVTLPLWD